MKISKKTILTTIVILLVLAIGITAVFVLPKFNKNEVEVYPVSRIREYAWGNQLGTYGNVVASNTQYVYLDNSLILDEIHVSLGDRVEVGDSLLSYDTTIQELQIRALQIQRDITLNNIKKTTNELNQLKTLVPSSPPPDPPTPKKLITDGGELTLLTAPTLAVSGDGSSYDKRYVFNCLYGVVLTKEFLEGLYQETILVQEEDDDEPDDSIEPVEAEEPEVEIMVLYVEFRIFYYNNVYIAKITVNGDELKDIKNNNKYSGMDFANSVVIDEEMHIREAKNRKDYGKLSLINDTVDYFGGPHYSAQEINLMVERKENELNNLITTSKSQALELETARETLNEGTVTSLISGIVEEINDIDTMEMGLPILVIHSEMGYRVEGSISELNYDKLSINQEVNVSSWRTGTSSTAIVTAIERFPARYPSGSSGIENPINSYYTFVAMIDIDDNLVMGDWVEIIIEGNSMGEPDVNDIYIPNAFIRQENGRSYVLIADDEGKLRKRYVVTGKSNYGYSTQIKNGLTLDDLIAFPYGKNVKEGTVTVVSEGMYW